MCAIYGGLASGPDGCGRHLSGPEEGYASPGAGEAVINRGAVGRSGSQGRNGSELRSNDPHLK